MGEVTTLGDLARQGRVALNDGYRTRADELGEPGVPILRVAEVQDGFITPTFGDHVRETFRAKFAQKTSAPNDVVVTTKGTVGRVALIGQRDPEFVYSPQVCFFRCGKDVGVLPEWLYYWFKGPEFVAQALGVQSQTDMAPYINLADMRALAITVPPIAEQRAIAGVLGALDDKIESNRRIVATSMAVSETTFLKWRGGLAAEETTTFGEFADVFGGATPSTSEPDYWGGDHVWVAPRDVTALDSVYLFDSERHVTDLGLARSSTTLHPPGSIFMTSRATIGAFAVNQVPCAPNQGFIVVRPRDPAARWFLFHEMRSRVVEMQDRATGTTFRELSRGSFREMTLSIPADDGSFIALDEAVAPVHARAAAAAQESQSLTAIRDALLPELLSGRLRVREAEEMVGSV